MTPGTNKKKTNQKPVNKRRGFSTPVIVAIIGLFGTILAAFFGIFSLNLNQYIQPTLQAIPETEPSQPLPIEEQIAILGATATKSAEMTATQFAMEVQRTTQAEMIEQQIRTEISASETQKVLSPTQTAEQIQFITSTANAYITATAQAVEAWQDQHEFIDEFADDSSGWAGDNKSAKVYVDPSNGVLNFETKKASRLAFWKCDACFLPLDHNDYSFEVKYFAPNLNSNFNIGLLFGCDQFDEELVSCQAIQLVNQAYIRVVKTGTSKEYHVMDYFIEPNEKDLISVRWEVSTQKLKIWINNRLAINDIDLDGGGGGFFGFYCDPTGPKVEIERIEIYPLP